MMLDHFYAEVCEEENSTTLKHLIENVNKPECVDEDEWELDTRILNNEFIEIVGFTYEPKINYGTPSKEPTLNYGGNPHQYHMYYRVLPQKGEKTTLKHLHLYRVSMARADSHIFKLDQIKFGTGKFIDDIIATKYQHMKSFFKEYSKEWFNRQKGTHPVLDNHITWQ